MIFSFVMSRLLYQFARQKLESGTEIGTLEQLMGSQTLGSAFKTHLQLQSFNILGLLLLCVWLLSPLGGQSLLRVLHEDTLPINTTVVYFDSVRQDMDKNSGIRDASFHMALLAPEEVKRRSEDPWGNVKIPIVESAPDGQWIDIHETPVYSSLVGIPVANVSRGNSTFYLESGYLNLTCGIRRLKNESTKGTDEADTAAFLKIETPLVDSKRSTNISSASWYGVHHKFNEVNDGVWFTIGLDRLLPDHELSFYSPDLDDQDIRPTNLLFQARDRYTNNDTIGEVVQVYRTECQVEQKYVESRVTCIYDQGSIRPLCKVVAQRPSREDHPPGNSTFLSERRNFHRVSQDMPRWYRGTGNRKSDPMLLHLYDPTMADYLAESSTQDLRKVTDEDFSIRLSQAINSFILAEQLGLSANPQFAKSTMFSHGRGHSSGIRHLNATAETTNFDVVYRIAWPWMIPCILSCAVLAAAGVLGVAYAHSGSGPDFLGFASTMLSDSRYIDMYSPEVDIGLMEGSELARLLKKRRIRYGRVRRGSNEEAVGIGREEEVTMLLRDL
jgi:hypothetical protein